MLLSVRLVSLLLAAGTQAQTTVSFLSTISGYSALAPCAQTALNIALNPASVTYTDCPTTSPIASFANCLCNFVPVEALNSISAAGPNCPEATIPVLTPGAPSVWVNWCRVAVSATSLTTASASAEASTTLDSTPTTQNNGTATPTSSPTTTNFNTTNSNTTNSSNQWSLGSGGIGGSIVGALILLGIGAACCWWCGCIGSRSSFPQQDDYYRQRQQQREDDYYRRQQQQQQDDYSRQQQQQQQDDYYRQQQQQQQDDYNRQQQQQQQDDYDRQQQQQYNNNN